MTHPATSNRNPTKSASNVKQLRLEVYCPGAAQRVHREHIP